MTCSLCDAGMSVVVWGEHVTPDGRRVLGPCVAAGEAIGVRDESAYREAFRARLRAWQERVTRPADLMAAPITLAAPPRPFTEADGEDD